MMLNYDWMADKESRSSPFSERSHGNIPRFEYIECLRYITTLMKGDRSCDGLLTSKERAGDTALWAQRLIELYAFRRHEEYGYDPELKWGGGPSKKLQRQLADYLNQVN